MVVVDECHHQAADTFQKATRTCNQARYLIGLSATPYRDDGADLELEAWLGPVIYNIGYQELIDAGYLVAPEFTTANGLEDALRITAGKKTLLFSEKIKDLDDARDTLLRHNVRILTGKNKSREISESIKDIKSGRITHIAATPIFDEGLDIPEVEAIINLATGRSRVRTIQRVGRIMRPAPGKTTCMVVDLRDDSYYDRMLAYRGEPAFARILSSRCR
jgi:superfamily II DNA or RNA helicase